MAPCQRHTDQAQHIRKVQVNPHTQLVLVQALEKYGFGTRTNEQETTEYEVVDIQLYQ